MGSLNRFISWANIAPGTWVHLERVERTIDEAIANKKLLNWELPVSET